VSFKEFTSWGDILFGEFEVCRGLKWVEIWPFNSHFVDFGDSLVGVRIAFDPGVLGEREDALVVR
jgi:hypothetical protein